MAVEIILTQGYTTVVDDKDSDLAELKWHAHVSFDGCRIYVETKVRDKDRQGKQLALKLHRVILERSLGRKLLKEEDVDHISMDGLDNRRSNLRVATRSQNSQNTPKRRNNTSGYKGVIWHKRNKKWYARIGYKGKSISLGLHDTPEQAYEAYKRAALELFGEYARFE